MKKYYEVEADLNKSDIKMNSESKLLLLDQNEASCKHKKNEYRKINLDSNNTSVKQWSESEIVKPKDSNILTISNLVEKHDRNINIINSINYDNLNRFEQKYKLNKNNDVNFNENNISHPKELVYIDSVDNQNKKYKFNSSSHKKLVNLSNASDSIHVTRPYKNNLNIDETELEISHYSLKSNSML